MHETYTLKPKFFIVISFVLQLIWAFLFHKFRILLRPPPQRSARFALKEENAQPVRLYPVPQQGFGQYATYFSYSNNIFESPPVVLKKQQEQIIGNLRGGEYIIFGQTPISLPPA